MAFLRAIGTLFLIAAFVALAFDGARTLATPAQGMSFMSLSEHLEAQTPGATEDFHRLTAAYAPQILWTALVEPVMTLPVSIVCGVLGAALFLAGYRRPPPDALTG